MERVLFPSTEECIEAEKVLDNKLLDYDYDSGNRMLLSDEGIEVLEENNIDFDLI